MGLWSYREVCSPFSAEYRIGIFTLALLQCSAERASQKNSDLTEALQQEKEFRSAIRRQAIMSYTVNIRKNCIIEGLSYFSKYIEAGGSNNYSRLLREEICPNVHPDDRIKVLEESTPHSQERQETISHIST